MEIGEEEETITIVPEPFEPAEAPLEVPAPATPELVPA